MMSGFEILHFRPWNGGGKTRAFAIVKLGPVTISGVKLIEGRNGPLVAGPATKDKHGDFHPLVTFERSLSAALLAALEAALADAL
jgi:DNA-binding cell septation regulator SpoVG